MARRRSEATCTVHDQMCEERASAVVSECSAVNSSKQKKVRWGATAWRGLG